MQPQNAQSFALVKPQIKGFPREKKTEEKNTNHKYTKKCNRSLYTIL